MVRVVEMLGDYNIRNWTSDAELQNLTEISGDSEYRQQQNAHYMQIHAFIGFTKRKYNIHFYIVFIGFRKRWFIIHYTLSYIFVFIITYIG